MITDPRTLGFPYPKVVPPGKRIINTEMLSPPLSPAEARQVELVKGPNIESLPELSPLPDELRATILLKAGDDISTDEILPAGARILPYRSNIPKISEFAFEIVDPSYAKRAAEQRALGGHAVIGGKTATWPSRLNPRA